MSEVQANPEVIVDTEGMSFTHKYTIINIKFLYSKAQFITLKFSIDQYLRITIIKSLFFQFHIFHTHIHRYPNHNHLKPHIRVS